MYNEHDGVSNHQPYDCLLNCLFWCRSKKTSEVRITGLCEGISPVTGEFPAQRKMFPFDDVIIFNPYVWERVVLSLSILIQQPSTPPPPPPPPPHPTPKLLLSQWSFLKCKGVNFKCHLNIRKYWPWAYILGFIELPYFGSWTVSADIFGWMYLYLYLYLNRCICICIWIKAEGNICICIPIWKIQIFVFVFVFVFDKMYLTPALN